MRTKVVIAGRVGHIVMTRRASENEPIEYMVRWNDNQECEWLTPGQLLFVS